MASSGLKIAIVGGGLAGLAAAMKIAEAGHEVDLISVVPVKRSHSVCAQGGINGAVNTKGEGDSPAKHLDDTVYGGDFLANQPPVKRMCDMAPEIIYLFRPHGRPVFQEQRRDCLIFADSAGTLHHRTAFAGASTGQQLLYALDEQVRKWETLGRVNKYEGWEMLLSRARRPSGMPRTDGDGLAVVGTKGVQGGRGDHSDRWAGLDLWKID
jgi:succinate dehydrogenase / fumarate reductase flavoprotein subunit